MFLNTLENIAMLIDGNMYIDWFEFPFPDPRNLNNDYTLQNIISNSANSLVELQGSLKHDVFPKLQSIQTPRQPTVDFAKELNLGPLMEKLDNHQILSPEDAKILFEEFLSRDMIYNNEECLETLDNCKKMLLVRHCVEIIKKVSHNEEEDFEENCQEKLGQILSETIDAMNEIELLQFLSHQKGYFLTPYTNIQFDSDLDEVLYDPSTEMTKVLKAIAKNPKEFLSMAVDIVTNSQKFHTEIHKRLMEHYITVLKIIATKVLNDSPLILGTLKDLMDLPVTDATGIAFFFGKIYKSSILVPSDFVKDLVIANIGVQQNSSGQKILNVSHTLMKILDTDVTGLTEFLPILLVSYGFLLDKVRSSLETFSEIASQLLELITAVMHKLVKVFLPVGTTNQKLFVQLQLKDSQPLTKYYLQKLDLEKGQDQLTLERFLHPDGFTSMEKRILTATFCEYLTKCTRKELTLLTKNPEIRHYFTDAMLIIAMSLAEQTFMLEFAVKNYAHLFQMMVNEENIGAVQECVALLKGVVKIFCSLPESQKEVVAYGIVAHLKRLIEKILESDGALKETVEEELAKTNVGIFKPEIIFGGK